MDSTSEIYAVFLHPCGQYNRFAGDKHMSILAFLFRLGIWVSSEICSLVVHYVGLVVYVHLNCRFYLVF